MFPLWELVQFFKASAQKFDKCLTKLQRWHNHKQSRPLCVLMYPMMPVRGNVRQTCAGSTATGNAPGAAAGPTAVGGGAGGTPLRWPIACWAWCLEAAAAACIMTSCRSRLGRLGRGSCSEHARVRGNSLQLRLFCQRISWCAGMASSEAAQLARWVTLCRSRKGRLACVDEMRLKCFLYKQKGDWGSEKFEH